MSKKSIQDLEIGLRVLVNNELLGVVCYVGTTSFQTGQWVGIELDEPVGKNSGVVQGKRYFDCKVNHGMFVRPIHIKPVERKSVIETKQTVETKRNSMAADKRKSVTTDVPKRKSMVTNDIQKRKSTIVKNTPTPIDTQKRKSIMDAQKRKSVINSPTTPKVKRPTSISKHQQLQSIVETKPRAVMMTAPTTPINESIQPEPIQEFVEEPEPIPGPVQNEPESIPDSVQNEQEFIPEPVQDEPIYGSLAPKSTLEEMVPLKDYKEILLKLKILENKRHEDRERFREYEKIKDEAEQFLTLRNRLQDKIGELQKDVRETRRELQDVLEEKETLEFRYNDILESMEMITLDKEVAEERVEDLQLDLDILKDKMEEMRINLEIIDHVPQDTSIEHAQLSKQNERLKQALLKVRDIAADQENESNNRIRQLEQELRELEDYQVQYELTKEKLKVNEDLVEELKIQLDDAAGAEELIEQLTEKNLSLSERVEELTASVEDLEALKELADELEENHVETERQLQAEIDHRDMLLREQWIRLRANEETEADYEATIQQFRELVILLQNDLQDMKQKERQNQDEKLSSQSQAMISLNMQLQSTMMKSQAKSIDIELRKLEAAQAIDRFEMSQDYLPDQYFKTENDPISCFLLFKRLEFKSNLVVKHLDQQYPVSEKMMDTISESLITLCDIKEKAGWVNCLSKRIQEFIRNCDMETFGKMGKIFHEFIGVETKMNSIIESFRMDQINESHILNEIQRILSHIEHVDETYCKQNIDGFIKSVDLNSDRILVVLTFIKQRFNMAVRNEGLVVIEGIDYVENNFMEPIQRLITQAKNSKMIAKKIIRQLEESTMDDLHKFKMLYNISTKLCKFCHQTYKEIVNYIESSQESIELYYIQKLIRDKSDEIFEMIENNMFESSIRNIKTLNNELEMILNKEKQKIIVTEGVLPWKQRAIDLKQKMKINHELEHKVQQQNQEIIKLIKDVKLKDQVIQEKELRIDLIENRMKVDKHQVQILELELSNLCSKESMYTEAIDNLQNDFDALEIENNELKKQVTKIEEKRQNMLKNINTNNEENGHDSEYYELLNQQCKLFKSTIAYLRSENSHLKCLDFKKSLELSDQQVIIPVKPRKAIQELRKETDKLIKDLRQSCASPKVVQLDNTSSLNYSNQQQSVLNTIKKRTIQLGNQLNGIQVNHTPKLNRMHKLGVVKIPTRETANRHCIDIHNLTEFNRLHTVFIK